MIDVQNEELLTFSRAARRLPGRGENSGVHSSTLYRWSQRGLRGIHLETVQVGGRRCTSMEALYRFFTSLRQASAGGANETGQNESWRRDLDVERKLESAGI